MTSVSHLVSHSPCQQELSVGDAGVVWPWPRLSGCSTGGWLLWTLSLCCTFWKEITKCSPIFSINNVLPLWEWSIYTNYLIFFCASFFSPFLYSIIYLKSIIICGYLFYTWIKFNTMLSTSCSYDGSLRVLSISIGYCIPLLPPTHTQMRGEHLS